MKLFFYDLETTGLDCKRHGIHQISGAIVIDGETKEEFNFKVQPNPYAVIDEEALKVAGVTKEEVMALATPYLAERRADMANFKLSTVAATLGIKVEEDKLHDAMYDIYLTQSIYYIVCRFS